MEKIYHASTNQKIARVAILTRDRETSNQGKLLGIKKDIT